MSKCPMSVFYRGQVFLYLTKALLFPVPSEQPQNVYAKDKTNATEISLSWEPPAEHTIHGILRGFFIWYSIIKLGIHERSPVFPWDYKKKQLPASSNKDTLTDLQTYASYSIRIAAFTSKGYGPIREISSSKSLHLPLILLREDWLDCEQIFGCEKTSFRLLPV